VIPICVHSEKVMPYMIDGRIFHYDIFPLVLRWLDVVSDYSSELIMPIRI
jgi:hypothetical protein